LRLPQRVLLIDYRFLELLGPVAAAQVLDKAEPALLAALAADAGQDLQVRISAAEAALRLNALSPDAAADIYRQQPPGDAARLAEVPTDPPLRRARLFRAIGLAQSPDLKARLMRALLDEARRLGIATQTARMLAQPLASLSPTREVDWFSGTAAEIALASGQFEVARRWAEYGYGAQHWLALIDIADPARQAGRLPGLVHLEALAANRRLESELLHRLATVVDALDIEVPIALWDAASRTPQPTAGFLPETGVLADLKQAAQRKDAGRTILLVMRALGPGGADGANILALGDAVRALKRAGLEAEARSLAAEALLAVWPRAVANR
jgi:hypothetical protein